MVFRYCFGMIMSVSTLMIFSGAATPSSVVNLSIGRTSWLGLRKRCGDGLSRMLLALKGKSAWPLSQRRAVSCSDAFSSREPVPTLDQVRGRLSLENALFRGLDRLHVVVGKAEMVADLVNQHVANDMTERFV